MNIEIFVNNPWQENTYLLYDETGEAILIDCGCIRDGEREKILSFLKANELKLVKLINTHLHIDHVLGVEFIKDTFGFSACANKDDEYLLAEAPAYSEALGFQRMNQPPAIQEYLQDGDVVTFGNTVLKALHTPGHSPGGMCYYCEEDSVVFVGDTLFSGSIGRTDLPGGSLDDLLSGIKSKLLILPSKVKVYTGHGASTTIDYEKHHNPFLT